MPAIRALAEKSEPEPYTSASASVMRDGVGGSSEGGRAYFSRRPRTRVRFPVSCGPRKTICSVSSRTRDSRIRRSAMSCLTVFTMYFSDGKEG